MKIKQFTETKFIRTLQDASQKGIDMDAGVLDIGYDKFAMLLYKETVLSQNRAEVHYILCHTRVELSTLQKSSRTLKKKCGSLSSKNH